MVMFYSILSIPERFPQWTYVLALLLWLGGGSLPAQTGFLRNYPDSTTGTYLWERPDGYLLLAYDRHLSPDTQYWVRHRVNTDGHKVTPSTRLQTEAGGFQQFPLRNGDVLASNYQQDDSVVVARRLTASGALLWEYTHSLGESNQALPALRKINVKEDADGNLYLFGFFENEADLTIDGYLLALGGGGQFRWSRTVDGNAFWPSDVEPFDLKIAENGTSLLVRASYNGTPANSSDDYTSLTRLDANGVALAQIDAPVLYYNNPNWVASGAAAAGRSFMLTASVTTGGIGPYTNVRLRVYTPGGALENECQLTPLFQAAMNNDPSFAVNYPLPTADGNFVLLLSTQQQDIPLKWMAVKITAAGQVLWMQDLPQVALKSHFFADGKEFADGSLGFLGWYDDPLANVPGMAFLKLGSDGSFLDFTLGGTVSRDQNDNCLVDTPDTPLPNWLLTIEHGQDAWTLSTNQAGAYTTPADTGAYTLTLALPNYLWEACDNPQTLTATSGGPANLTADFAMTALAECPFMQVDLLNYLLAPGVNNTYILRYCNTGTAGAAGAAATLEFDPLLTVVSASEPYTWVNGALHFSLGDVPAGACNDIEVVVFAPDDPNLYGTALCATAHITPDSICLPAGGNWSGALLEARGYCDGDSARFEVRNIGVGPSTPNLEYIVADDHVIMYQGVLPALAPGASTTRAVAAPAGGSWRLSLEQEPNAPAGEAPSVPVEGCTGPGNGMAIQLSNQTGSPFSDLECRILIGGAIVSPEMSASPTGAPSQNVIEKGARIAYRVRFESTTPVKQVVLADALPVELDAATFEAGPASLPYTWHIGADGVLYLRFESDVADITQGIVEYSVKTKNNLPDGTEIINGALLSFDQDAPLPTNTVLHTIGTPLITVGVQQPVGGLPALGIRPNPCVDGSLIEWPAGPATQQRLTLRDSQGRLRWDNAVTGSAQWIDARGLAPGLYFLEYRRAGVLVAAGKWIVR